MVNGDVTLDNLTSDPKNPSGAPTNIDHTCIWIATVPLSVPSRNPPIRG